MSIGYCVVVFNQASGQPLFEPHSEVFGERAWAIEEAARVQDEYRSNGRLECVVACELCELREVQP